jgi:glycosyltransferase involved in cell wall biosynthesis
VLSSYSEAFPLSLVEYGKAGLAAIATDVGECPAILDHGRAGLIVPPGDAQKLAEALLHLLNLVEKRRLLGATLQQRITHLYTAESVLEQIGGIYQRLLQ